MSSRISFVAGWRGVFTFLLLFFLSTPSTAGTAYVTIDEANGEEVSVPDDRRPSLYTKDFGDCQSDSIIQLSRFDGAFFRDNMTVTINMDGTTTAENENVMLYIEVYAYGELRFQLTFNPCSSNMASLCPLKAGVPVQISEVIPVSSSEISTIPTIAYTIPDFEGQVIARIFSNTTESQAACTTAVLTNGSSFRHPKVVGGLLGGFAALALVASAVAAMYGNDLATTRSHYAHSLSTMVVFSVLQHIFFSGILSMNWPSVVVAFWSNYAWSAGMIYSSKMQHTISAFLGGDYGNIGMLGAAAAYTTVSDLGGGYDIDRLYPGAIASLRKRSSSSSSNSSTSDSTSWYGGPVKAGLPLPGNYSGFAGTLAQEGIPASNAFMTGFLWLLVLIALVPVSVALFRLMIAGLGRIKLVNKENWIHFRTHWLRFAVFAMLRTTLIAFFMTMVLTMFQFAFNGPAGVLAIAAIVFIIFLLGLAGISAYALYCRMRGGRFVSEADRLLFRGEKVLFCVPWMSVWRASRVPDMEAFTHVLASLPWWRLSYDADPKLEPVHDDIDYLMKFGWLYARFRRSKWFTFTIWLAYEFVRACFFGGAVAHPLIQVFGLLAVEIISFVGVVWLRPFQATRLNALMVYLLGFSKVATLALSAAFHPRFGLSRILTAVIGIAIIIIQGILTILLIVSILLGAVSTYMSLTRDRDIEQFKPRSWRPMRMRYLAHVEKSALDLPPAPRPPTPPPPPTPEEPKGPSFAILSVKRYPKIEDEDTDNWTYTQSSQHPSNLSLDRSITPSPTPSPITVDKNPRRSTSVQSRRGNPNLPFGARPYRSSWTSHDFERWRKDHDGPFENTEGEEMNETASLSSEDHSTLAPSRLSRDSTASLRRARNLKRASSTLSRSDSPGAEASLSTFLRTRNSAVLDDVNEDAREHRENEEIATPPPAHEASS
ncbi:hypothetical protein ASPZODRAFT_73451 [Penicilliopsis zonata CBS 506.65]|uniref:ML-like domain-containing protein n=1 Tax=Penicilliopsis zonata CBS 506.65 TaxID=1073090 RepID=A0A1L9S9W6_9EURO|nr:hypothetical protein ASPZODRAFT_73451 [Penicilliopsis zonata CBS 506.65]OJJ43907.1 hypothetical protein ASPZODRAFT_73451 [Penicilliopsis zonata CBS 506.65]